MAKLTLNDIQFVILAAGKSTRNYPHSKGIPHKSLIPFGSRKIIDHIIQNIISIGGKNILIVVSDKSIKKDFRACFKPEKDVEKKFEKKGDMEMVKLIKSLYLPEDINLRFAVQEEPKGLAHALGVAKKQVPEARNFFMILPDDIVVEDKKASNKDAKKTVMKRMIETYLKGEGGNLFLTRKIKDPSRWGIIDNGVFKEKPKKSKSKESFIAYAVFDKDVVKKFAQSVKDVEKKKTPEYIAFKNGKEIHFSEYLNKAVKEDKKKMGIRTMPILKSDTYLDCGTLAGYEEALIYTLLKESMFKSKNLKFAKKIIEDLSK